MLLKDDIRGGSNHGEDRHRGRGEVAAEGGGFRQGGAQLFFLRMPHHRAGCRPLWSGSGFRNYPMSIRTGRQTAARPMPGG